MLENPICKLLNIEYPIIQGGMAWVADANLAAAVSNGGGLGVIAAGAMTPEILVEEIQKLKKLTDKPFGVNVMLLSPHVDAIAEIVLQEKVPIVTTGAGSPAKYISAWKEAGIKVIPVVASVAYAKRMEDLGADAIIAEGMEAGGHIGDITTMLLLPQTVDAVNIPVIAAGGIADGRGFAAAFVLGASAIQMGTRFIVCEECQVHANFKEKVIKAKDISTIVTGRSGGHPVRSLKTPLTKQLAKLDKENAPFEEMEALAGSSLRKAVKDGDIKEGSFMAGQSAGLVEREQTAKDIIIEIITEATAVLNNLTTFAKPLGKNEFAAIKKNRKN